MLNLVHLIQIIEKEIRPKANCFRNLFCNAAKSLSLRPCLWIIFLDRIPFDWEWILMASVGDLEERFQAAVKGIQRLPSSGKMQAFHRTNADLSRSIYFFSFL